MQIKTFCGVYDHNFSYLIIEGKECALIDPAVPAVEILNYVNENGLRLKFIVIMHSHFDHLVDLLKYRKEGISWYGHQDLKIKVDKTIEDGNLIYLGKIQMKVMHTPGHTPDAICLLLDNHLFTSDTLFVGGCGRTDLPGGNSDQLKRSLNRLQQLSDSVIIYPGHDYGSTKTSTIKKEKQNNPYFK